MTPQSIPDLYLTDEKLPHLKTLADAQEMLRHFSHRLKPQLAQSGMRVKTCAIERIQHRRGKRCRFLYRLVMESENGQTVDHWFIGKVVPSRKAGQHFKQAQQSTCQGNGIWPTLSFWPDLDLILWSFPYDPDMPRLVKAADVEFVRRNLNANLPCLGLEAPWHCEEVGIEKVKYMPGKRCVLKIHARLSHPAGDTRNLVFFNKTYSDGKAQFHFEILNKVYQAFQAAVTIPRPLLFLPAANSFWQEPFAGTPLMDQLEVTDWQKLFPRLGKAVATYHKSQCPGLPKDFHPQKVLFSATEDAQSLAYLLPERKGEFEAALERLVAYRERMLQQAKHEVPIHGALRLEQFLASDNGLALVDFDAASVGDPLFDVAEFLTSLQYLQFSQGLSSQKIQRAFALFKAGYQKNVPWRLDRDHLAWYAVAFLLGKLHDTIKNLEVQALAHLPEILQLMNTWLEQLEPRPATAVQ